VRYLILLGVSGETVVTPRSRNAYASLWRRSAPSTSATVRWYWPATWVTVFRKRCSRADLFALPAPQLDLRTAVQHHFPAAAAGQRELVDAEVVGLELRRKHAVHAQHLPGLLDRTVQARQVLVHLGHVGFEHVAEAVDQLGTRLVAPAGHGHLLGQRHAQLVRELAPHHRAAHPRHRLEGGARTREIDGEEVARELRRHVGAQRDRVVVRDLAVHLDPREREERLAQHPPRARGQQHERHRHEREVRHDVHELDVEGRGDAVGHGYCTPPFASSEADASTRRHSSS
jgi:hypothetical protein